MAGETGQPSQIASSTSRRTGLADAEAAWWEALSEYARTRVYWRAALAARQHAQHAARRWRRHAAYQQAAELPAQPASMGAVA